MRIVVQAKYLAIALQLFNFRAELFTFIEMLLLVVFGLQYFWYVVLFITMLAALSLDTGHRTGSR